MILAMAIMIPAWAVLGAFGRLDVVGPGGVVGGLVVGAPVGVFLMASCLSGLCTENARFPPFLVQPTFLHKNPLAKIATEEFAVRAGIFA
jgi:hypothetical protein